jgi:NADH dehydrogenase FAD-containing subunit
MGVNGAKEVRNKPVVIVVGGGYAGISAAKGLDRDAEFNVVLIDRKDHMMHNMASVRAVVQPGFEHDILISYQSLLKYGSVVAGEVTSITEHAVTIHGHKDPVKFDYLVIATGSSYPFPGKLSKPKIAEAAEVFKDAQFNLRGATSVCIIGGGPVGVELAGEIATEFPDKQVTLIHAHFELCGMKGLQPEYCEKIANKLRQQKVNLILGDRAILEEGKRAALERQKKEAIEQEDYDLAKKLKAEIEALVSQNEKVSFALRDDVPLTFLAGPRTIRTQRGKEIKTDLTYFCSGTTINNHALKRFDLPELMDNGRLKVDDKLRVVGMKNVFAIGDISNREFPMGYLATKQGEYIAEYFKKVIVGKAKEMKDYYVAPVPSAIVSLGRNAGVAQLAGPGMGKAGRVFGSTIAKSAKSRDMYCDANWELLNMDRATKQPLDPTKAKKKQSLGLAAALATTEEEASKIKAGALPEFDIDKVIKEDAEAKRKADAGPDMSASGLLEHDAELAGVKRNKLPEKFGKKAEKEAIETTKAALTAKAFKVTLVKSKIEALRVLIGLCDANKSYGQSASTTLQEIGWMTYLKEHPNVWGRNFKADAVAAIQKQDFAGSAEANRLGLSADVFVTSCAALTEAGEIVAADETGTRTGAFAHTAGNLVVVVSGNKIVPDMATAMERVRDWCLPLESARVRVAYKAVGIQASKITNLVTLRGANPFGTPQRVHVILISDEVLGF